jgi:hypothetical protein
MEQKKYPVKSALKYGVIFGILMALQFVILSVMTIDYQSFPVFIMNLIIFPIIIIAISCKNYKKNINNGYISIVECLKIGVTICLIAVLIYLIFSTVFNNLFPEFIENIIIKIRQSQQDYYPNLPPDQAEILISQSEKYMRSNSIIAFLIVSLFFIIGLIYSLIIGIFIKKNNPKISIEISNIDNNQNQIPNNQWYKNKWVWIIIFIIISIIFKNKDNSSSSNSSSSPTYNNETSGSSNEKKCPNCGSTSGSHPDETIPDLKICNTCGVGY